ncbi:hypothetical protein ACET81_21500 [Aeromonas veronii]|uniref:hypothetical protein n=1 Tax=Aeromonas hydrophila TaxID=644 RepID=UPI001C5B653D|nr:hypothetical protein [Aeromonas hydrophila]MBW3834734.1 hypothetical protein [Aeromonas hydrophila]MBW5280294.1 hypothetical protein [Aeromonas hydrophila]
MTFSAHMNTVKNYVSASVAKGVAFGLLASFATVGAYHQITFKPRVEALEASQQRLVTVDITGLVREKAADIALRKNETIDDQGAAKIAELQTYNDKIQRAIDAFNVANGGNLVVLPKQAVASRVDDITPIIKKIAEAQPEDVK